MVYSHESLVRAFWVFENVVILTGGVKGDASI